MEKWELGTNVVLGKYLEWMYTQCFQLKCQFRQSMRLTNIVTTHNLGLLEK